MKRNWDGEDEGRRGKLGENSRGKQRTHREVVGGERNEKRGEGRQEIVQRGEKGEQWRESRGNDSRERGKTPGEKLATEMRNEMRQWKGW